MSTTIAEFNYIVPTTQRPRSFTYPPADGSPRTTVTTESHRLPVGNLRQEDGPFVLDDDQGHSILITSDSIICRTRLRFMALRHRASATLLTLLNRRILRAKLRRMDRMVGLLRTRLASSCMETSSM